jgi:hypothetical protein
MHWPDPRRRSRSIDPDQCLCRLLRDHPEAWAVLDRHASAHGTGTAASEEVRGRGETVRDFALSHRIDLEGLIAELDQALGAGPGRRSAIEPCRLLMPAALGLLLAAVPALALSANTAFSLLMGAVALALIASVESVSSRDGSAHVSPSCLRWVPLLLVLYIAGLALRLLASWSGQADVTRFGHVLTFSSALIAVVWLAVRASQRGLISSPSQAFLSAAGAWAVLAELLRLVVAIEPSRLGLGLKVGGPRMDLALDLDVLGLGLFGVLGLGLRLLPAGTRERNWRAWWAFDLMTTALLAELALLVAYELTGDPRVGLMRPVVWTMLALGSMMTLQAWAPWRTGRSSRRFAWGLRCPASLLVASCVVLGPVPLGFVLAGRHWPVGLPEAGLTLLLLGVVLPLLLLLVPRTIAGRALGVMARSRRDGNLAWSSGATATASAVCLGVFGPGSAVTMGALAVSGAFFCGWAIALGSNRSVMDPMTFVGPLPPGRIEPWHAVADVIDWYPEAGAVFASRGLEVVRRPGFGRLALARRLSVARAAELGGLDLKHLLHALNRAIHASFGSSSALLGP